MEGTPPWVQVVVADDDPLNLPSELISLKERVKEPQLLVLPHGGHLGFGGTKWVAALLANYFKP